MKNGLLVYMTNNESHLFNIGDYIQSLAAAQFFDNKIDVYLNREKLSEYNGDDVKLIMNGWFTHIPQNWPPSDKIHPLFVAFHLNKLADKELLSEKSIAYFKKYEPIGCRDYDTVEKLQSKGVKSYFSACMTLTLGLSYKYKGERSNNIYFTDVPIDINKSVKNAIIGLSSFVLHPIEITRIYRKRYPVFLFSKFLSNIFFFMNYSKLFTTDVLINATYSRQEIVDDFESEETKFYYAKELLEGYSKAQYVVTSRIHCALPCLALDTPVLYVYDDNQGIESSCRMKGLLELFNVIYYNKGKLTGSLPCKKINRVFTFKNKPLYMQYKEKLMAKCIDFVKRNY